MGMDSTSNDRRRHSRWPEIAGALAFLACFATGIGMTVVVVWVLQSARDPPTEVYEVSGDSFVAVIALIIGLVVSFIVALIASLAVSAWAGKRAESSDRS
jgi:putative flippase GtrA